MYCILYILIFAPTSFKHTQPEAFVWAVIMTAYSGLPHFHEANGFMKPDASFAW